MSNHNIPELDLEKECENFIKSLVQFTVASIHFFSEEEFFDILIDKLYAYMSSVQDLYKINLIERFNKLYIAEHHPEVFEIINEELKSREEQEENNVDYKEK